MTEYISTQYKAWRIARVLGPLLALFVLVVIASCMVLWHLWYAKVSSGRPAFCVETLTALLFVLFLLYSFRQRHYRDFVIASISCLSTDVAWLTRLMHVHF